MIAGYIIIPLIIVLGIIGLIVIAKDTTIIYRECPNCHTHKTIYFSWVGLLLTSTTVIIPFIYLLVKIWQLRCTKCHCLTQKIVITHNELLKDKAK